MFLINIDNNCLKSGQVYCIRKKVCFSKSRKILIKGRVTTPKNLPSIGASIEVVEIIGLERNILGYVFTDTSGFFGFSVDYKPSVDYELNVYSPL
jgi:hypothetical protein